MKVKNEQIGTNQTSNVEDEETDDDNIPLNKLNKHRHTVITKHWGNRKKKVFVIKLFITSYNKNQ